MSNRILIWGMLIFSPLFLMFPNFVKADFVEHSYLELSDPLAGDLFGAKLSIDGDYAAVAINGKSQVAVLYKNNGIWEEQERLSEAGASSVYGQNVAIYGDWIAVGDFNDATEGANAGAVFLYKRTGSDWNFVQKIISSDVAAGDFFGDELAMGDGYLLVGAYGDNIHGAQSGSVYLFRLDVGDTWVEEEKIVPSVGAANAWFGRALDISEDGNTIVVGAYRENETGVNSGMTYVFERDFGGPNNWGEVKRLIPSVLLAGDIYGSDVKISGDGNLIISSSPSSDGNGIDSGSVFLFAKNAGGANNWGEIKFLTASDAVATQRYGNAIDLNEEVIVIGAYGDTSESGQVYVYEKDLGGVDNWGEAYILNGSQVVAGNRFGIRLAMDEDLIVSAPNYSGTANNAGMVYFFSEPLPTNSISGVLVDENGDGINGKTVSVVNPSGAVVSAVTANNAAGGGDDGEFLVSGVNFNLGEHVLLYVDNDSDVKAVTALRENDQDVTGVVLTKDSLILNADGIGSVSNIDIYDFGAVDSDINDVVVATATDMTVNGDLLVNVSSFAAPSGNLTISGDLIIQGIFNPMNGKVILNGENQSVLGINSSFYDFEKKDLVNDGDGGTLTFEAGRTYYFLGDVVLEGFDANDLLAINSTSSGFATTLQFDGSSTLVARFLRVRDNTIVDNSSSLVVPVNPVNSLNDGNTVNWFGVVPPVNNNGGGVPLLKPGEESNDFGGEEGSCDDGKSFSDVKGHWGEEYIYKLKALCIVSGKRDGIFDPNGYVTRAELTKMVLLANGRSPVEVTVSGFKDVDVNAWYVGYVEQARAFGFVEGYGDGTFRPNVGINRVEALAIVVRSFGFDVRNVREHLFLDTNRSAWYANILSFAVENNIVAGYGDGNFGPSNGLTRAEAAKIIVLSMEL